MDRGSRPVGRKKRVGAGGGGVWRRGGGLGGSTGGPVGDAGGYAGRAGGSSGGRTGGTSWGGGRTPAGGRGLPVSGCSPKILLVLIVIVAIVAVILYLLFRSGGGGPDGVSELTGGGPAASQPGQVASGPDYSDPGEYPVVTSVSPLARAKRTVLQGDGTDTATVMVYICGTDLESQSGMATADLQEILYAEISDRVNIIVETGGATSWRNSVISNASNQRYRLTNEGLEPLEKDLGKKSMVQPSTLSDFIRYSKAKYPADRYMLVLWDHGGGSLTGYGYDQFYPRDTMTLDEIATGLKSGGCAFDLIGFDACLMATLETAVALEPYADYMIASEEVEPGIGWHYTGWITALSQNTSIPTTDLGKRLIDDYVSEVKAKTPRSQATLSLIDLAELKGTLPSAFTAFARSTSGLIDRKEYGTISGARADAKEFAASSKINQVDLIHFAERLGTPEADSLAQVLRGCIKYNRTSTNISNANGVSIFFPSGRLSQLDSMLDTYDQIGMASEYSDCLRDYASVTAGGQVVSSGSGNMLESLLGGLAGGGQPSTPPGGSVGGTVQSLLQAFLASGNLGSISGLAGASADWLDLGRMQESLDYYQANRFDASALVITEKGGQRVLALPDEQWALVQNMRMNVFADDGEGFIDLGQDNVYEYNADGDLLMEYDGTWLALNDHIVSYYMISEDRDGDTYTIRGRVPALLNDQMVDIILVFDDRNPYGMVLGAQPKYDPDTQTDTVAKGLLEILPGDRLDFLCDYYTYEGRYSDSYFLGDPYVATGEWVIENLPIGDMGYQMTYLITDIYGNEYWTPSVSD